MMLHIKNKFPWWVFKDKINRLVHSLYKYVYKEICIKYYYIIILLYKCNEFIGVKYNIHVYRNDTYESYRTMFYVCTYSYKAHITICNMQCK